MTKVHWRAVYLADDENEDEGGDEDLDEEEEKVVSRVQCVLNGGSDK